MIVCLDMTLQDNSDDDFMHDGHPKPQAKITTN